MRPFRGLVALLAALSGGCFVPRPEHYQRVPDLSGVIVDTGYPVPNAKVWYSEARLSCQPPSAVSYTGADGSFRLAGLQKFRLGVVVTGGDPGVGWSLCIQPPGKGVLHQTESMMGYEAPRQVALHCDLSRTHMCERTSIAW